jgi:hypothetical protein
MGCSGQFLGSPWPGVVVGWLIMSWSLHWLGLPLALKKTLLPMALTWNGLDMFWAGHGVCYQWAVLDMGRVAMG